MSARVAAIEIGGSHVSAARVDIGQARVEPPGVRRFALDAGSSTEELVETIASAALGVMAPEITLVGVATPGPFDYERGIGKFEGVAKLDALYGVDLRARIARDLGLDPEQVRFLNDAHAFVLGEWWAGAAKGHARAMGVTLGTGLGSGFLVGGRPVISGSDIPPDARLDLLPFRGGPVEDILSSRGIVAASGTHADVADIARHAHTGDAKALAVFRGFGSALAEFLDPWIGRFRPTCLVFGGSITRAWDLFGTQLEEASNLPFCGPARLLDEAPLLGAALHSARAQSETS